MMIQPWIRDYILLALRLDKTARRFDEMPFVDCFYGPPELKSLVESEPQTSLDDLTRIALSLADTLPAQGFESRRSRYLARHVRAMEAICRKLAGHHLPLEEVTQQCLDVQPVWKPEAEFERALALLDAALPGTGDVRARFRAYQEQTRLPPSKSELVLPLMKHILAEARRRTQQLIQLPEGEELDVQLCREKPYGAAHWYLGNYRSQLELNVERPVYVFALLYQMCHEAYPGHHTEYILKEQHLYRQRGYAEQSVHILGPQLVIAEGIASLASEIIFTPEEITGWAVEHLYPLLSVAAAEVDLPKLVQGVAGIGLDDLGSNLATMLRNGRSEQEALDYALAYTPFSAEHVGWLLEWLKSPLAQIYAFSYYQGKRLLQPLLQGDARSQMFRRLMTEHVYPSLLEEWAVQKPSG